MKLYKEKEIKTIEQEEIGIICDLCNNKIESSNLKNTYYSVWNSHDDEDGFEEYDFCSIYCLSKHMNLFFENSKTAEEYGIEKCSI